MPLSGRSPHGLDDAGPRVARVLRTGSFLLFFAISIGIPGAAPAQETCGVLEGPGPSGEDAAILRSALAGLAPLGLDQSLLCNVIDEIRAPGLEPDPLDLAGACSMVDAVVMARAAAGLPPGTAQVCPLGSPEPCTAPHVGVGCNRPFEVGCVCGLIPECCTVEWGLACVETRALPECAQYCGNGILEPGLVEECDDANVCPYDGCAPDGCLLEQSVVVTSLLLGPATDGFDLDNADGDGNIYTGIDNRLASNGLLNSQFNTALQAALEDGSIIQLIDVGDLDNVPYSGVGTPGYQDDPEIALSFYPGVDPFCPTPPIVPWVAPGNAPWELFSDGDAFVGCTPPVLITDADDPGNGIFPTLTFSGPPPAPYLHARGPSLRLPFGATVEIDVVSPILEATVTNDGSVVTGLANGVVGGTVPAESLWKMSTVANFGTACPTALHVVLGFGIGGPDQDVDGGGLEGVSSTCGGFCILPCISSSVTIDPCVDEDGTVIPDVLVDGDCVLDPRIADGYSTGFTFSASQVHVTSQESRSLLCP